MELEPELAELELDPELELELELELEPRDYCSSCLKLVALALEQRRQGEQGEYPLFLIHVCSNTTGSYVAFLTLVHEFNSEERFTIIS